MNAKEQVTNALRELGQANRQQIQQKTGTNINTVGFELSRGVKEGRFKKITHGVYEIKTTEA